MSEERNITFRSHGHYLSISLHERPYATSDSEWDRAAMRATLSAEASPFRASLTTLIWDQDIADLLKALKELSSAVGREVMISTNLGGYEEVVKITFGLDKTGGLSMLVTIVDDPALLTAELRFVIEADQSYLAEWIDEIERLQTITSK